MLFVLTIIMGVDIFFSNYKYKANKNIGVKTWILIYIISYSIVIKINLSKYVAID